MNRIFEAFATVITLTLFLSLTDAPGQTCATLPAGLVSWWRAENDAEDAIGGNAGNLSGGINFFPGKVGLAFSFDGIDGRVVISNSTSLNFASGADFSIEAWVQPVESSTAYGVMTIVDKREVSSGVRGYELYLQDGRLSCQIAAGTYGDFQSPGPDLRDGNLHHVVWTMARSAENGGRLYVDGANVLTFAATSYSGDLSNEQPLRLGNHGDGTLGTFFKGLRDEVSLYTRALEESEVQSLFAAGVAGKCTTPLEPFIFSQPTNQTVAAGTMARLLVLAGGTPPLSYQWTVNGVPLADATNAALTFTNVDPSQSGTYAVTVTNLYGSIVSSSAVLTVMVYPPAILIQPTNQDIIARTTGTLAVSATGTPPLSYQWSFNGSDLPTATNASLVLPDFSTNEAGRYQVTITNLYGSVTSSSAVLSIAFLVTNLFDDFEPGIDGSQWGGFGGTVLATNYGGSVSPSHALWFGGGGSRFAATLPIDTVKGGTIRYYLRLGTGFSSVWDRPELPGDGVVLECSTNAGVDWVSFATNNTSQYFSWIRVSVQVPAKAESPLTLFRWRQLANDGPSADHWALEDVVITTIAAPPEIQVQPGDQSATAGGEASFSAAVAGSPALSFQWRHNAADIPGATNVSLTLTNVQPSQAGVYSLKVANVAGTVVSAEARLKVAVVFASGNGQPLADSAHYFSGPVSVELTNAFPGGLIFYTLDASSPTFSSSRYTVPFEISQNAVLRAIGYRADFLESGELEPVSIIIVPPVPLAVSTPGGGSVAVDPPGGAYPSNSLVRLTAMPYPGWTFLQWLGDAGGSNATTEIRLTRPKSVQAIFGTTLDWTVAPVGAGSLAFNPPGRVYPYGSVVQISAMPAAGNYFALWGNAASGNLNPLRFMMTNANPIVSSLFAALPPGQVAAAVVPVGLGSVSVSPQANTYPFGTTVTITAAPDAGQTLVGWSGDGSGAENPLALTLDGSKLVYANFSARPRLALRSSAVMLQGESAQLEITGAIGDRYELDASADLSNWTRLAFLTNSAGSVMFMDTAASNTSPRFYRAVIIP